MAKKPRSRKRRYALVGLGGRSRMFSEALLKTYRDTSELVALCDTNQTRMAWHNANFVREFGTGPVPAYRAAAFDRMIAETKPDVVIVVSTDRTHDKYIIRAMELGCDVISEKPMTTDDKKCRAILQTVKKTGRKLTVTFNYRYAPTRSKVKELIKGGAIGEVTAVHFEWLLDTMHGADYFRRWHRDKRNSGGLMVHKSTHHFDLVNWWLDSSPETVFGFGRLAFYGRENARKRGVRRFYDRSTGHPNAKGDPFALDLRDGGQLQGLYFEAEHEDGYRRDQSVFGEGITIEDTMNVLVRYRNGVQLSYTLTAYAPWEGMRVTFTGTKGRIQLEEVERSYINAGGSGAQEGSVRSRRLTLQQQWKHEKEIAVEEGVGGHGGGDVKMLDDIFGPGKKRDPLGRAAGHLDGARSILTGIAANKSFATGLPVKVDKILHVP
jgi:predicted dehydrogenase